MKEEDQDKGNKKKHKAMKVKKKVVKSNSKSESDSEPTQKKCHHANKSYINPEKTLRVLKASLNHTHSCLGKTATNDDLFIVHPDSGASNHMTHR